MPLPEDAAIALALAVPKRARSTIFSLEPRCAIIEHWAAQGVSGMAIHAMLKREHGFTVVTRRLDFTEWEQVFGAC